MGPAQAHAADEGRLWAVLIGVEKYEKARRLMYTVNDARQLARTLAQRGSADDSHIITVVDEAEDPQHRPLRENLLQELPAWLSHAEPQDPLIVYFSGHGFQDDQGRLYLAPIDCDPRRPAETGIAAQWLREQISQCRAGTKLLILDACHAGTERSGETSAGVTARRPGRTVSRLERRASRWQVRHPIRKASSGTPSSNRCSATG